MQTATPRLAGALAVLAALFSLALIQPAGAQDATIMLLHGIPDTDVDVVVDGEVVIADYSFGAMEDLSAFAGQTLVGLTVNLAGTDTVAIDLGDFDVPHPGTTASSLISTPPAPRPPRWSRPVRPLPSSSGRPTSGLSRVLR